MVGKIIRSASVLARPDVTLEIKLVEHGDVLTLRPAAEALQVIEVLVSEPGGRRYADVHCCTDMKSQLCVWDRFVHSSGRQALDRTSNDVRARRVASDDFGPLLVVECEGVAKIDLCARDRHPRATHFKLLTAELRLDIKRDRAIAALRARLPMARLCVVFTATLACSFVVNFTAALPLSPSTCL